MGDEAPPDGDDTVKRATVWAKVIGIVGAALIGLVVPAYTAYQLAASEARAAAAKVAAAAAQESTKAKVETQERHNEAESGYQILLKEVEVLRAEKAARLAKSHRRRVKPPALKPLPTDLKKAEAVVFGAPAPAPPAVPAQAPRPDASP